MEIPQKLQFKKDSRNESKIFAAFTTNNYPEFIRIKGTEDFTKVKKNNKEWFSKSKYPDLAVTLQLFKNNVIQAEPSYLADGNLYTPPANNICDILGFDARIGEGNNVIIEWQSITESNIQNYVLLYQQSPESSYVVLDENILPKGSNQFYSIPDNSPHDKTQYVYTLIVTFNDGIQNLIGVNPVFEAH